MGWREHLDGGGRVQSHRGDERRGSRVTCTHAEPVPLGWHHQSTGVQTSRVRSLQYLTWSPTGNVLFWKSVILREPSPCSALPGCALLLFSIQILKKNIVFMLSECDILFVLVEFKNTAFNMFVITYFKQSIGNKPGKQQQQKDGAISQEGNLH